MIAQKGVLAGPTGVVEVYLAGRLQSCPNGRLFLRHRNDPRELEDAALESEVRDTTSQCGGHQFVEVSCDVPPSQHWVSIYGTVDDVATSGLGEPRVVARRFAPYPRAYRDPWDEWRIDDHRFPQFELSRAAIRRSETDEFSRAVMTRRTSELREAEVATEEILRTPIWAGMIGIGATLVPGTGFLAYVMVPIITDEMRAWLRATPHRIGVYPIVRRTPAR